ncbi:uncharacterized protein LOC142576124 isoform X3 [Dermacentor variabilis]|uniref:uncharacterized protein LOC142576124 isoform X3 n=1 Tax=Dermacentor variabilis TaxID=34621 RepID=UPI003F5B666E
MGRARKDSFNQPPVETYRKFIGKHENKKSKSDIKESKKRVQSKKTKSKTYKPFFLDLFTCMFKGACTKCFRQVLAS